MALNLYHYDFIPHRFSMKRKLFNKQQNFISKGLQKMSSNRYNVNFGAYVKESSQAQIQSNPI